MAIQIVLDCQDPEALAAFWCAALGYERYGSVGQYVSILPADGDGPKMIFQKVAEPKASKNRMHIDYSVQEAEREADRLEALGATRAPDARHEEFGMVWITMLDPEGNEFCIEQA